MAKIIDYTIRTDTRPDDLAEEVREYIKQGWQPLGGVSVSEYWAENPDTHYAEYVQAMVKYDEDSK